MNVVERKPLPLARNIRRLGHIDLPGAGQVCVSGKHAYVGHIPNKDHLGTSIVDISDPENPRVVAHHHARRSHLAQPQGARGRRHHDRQSRAQSHRHRPPRRRVAARDEGIDRRQGPRADAGGDRDLARRRAVRRGGDRGGGQARLSHGRLQGLRRVQSDEAEGDRAPEDRRHRRAPLRHGRALRLHLDRDGRLHRQHPGHLRHARSGKAAGGVALVDARAAHRRRRDADLARPAAPAAPCAALRRRDVGELLARRLPHRRRLRHVEAEDQRRLQLSPAVSGADPHRDAGAEARSTAGASRLRSTRRTRRRAPTRSRRGGAGRMPAS